MPNFRRRALADSRPASEIENGDVRVQIKATDSVKVVSGRSSLAVRLDWRDMIYWLNEPLPVILVVYDAKADRAWWLHIQQALRAEPRHSTAWPPGSVTVSIPLANVLDAAAVRGFRKFRNAVVARSRG